MLLLTIKAMIIWRMEMPTKAMMTRLMRVMNKKPYHSLRRKKVVKAP